MSYDAPAAYAPTPIYVYRDEQAIQRRRYCAVSPVFDQMAKGSTTNAAVRVLTTILKKHFGMPLKQKAEIIPLKDAKELERVWRAKHVSRGVKQ